VLPPLLNGVCNSGHGVKRHQSPPMEPIPFGLATTQLLRLGAQGMATLQSPLTRAVPGSEHNDTPHQSTVTVNAPAANCG
jgi:hypothetical protein